MDVDRHGLEILGREECLRLLRPGGVGRVVVTDRALPAAFPVNYALLDDDIVFLTSSGSKLTAAEGEEVVAFEIDEIHSEIQAGWSVLVQGLASVIEDEDTLARAAALDLRPWAPVGDFRFVRILSELVSGRRLLPQHERGGGPAGALVPAAASTLDPAGLVTCPTCGSRQLLAVTDGFTRNFLCATCAACWHIEQDGLRRVHPESCRGCSFKPMCTAAAARGEFLAGRDAERTG
jgi:hypothetical protein